MTATMQRPESRTRPANALAARDPSIRIITGPLRRLGPHHIVTTELLPPGRSAARGSLLRPSPPAWSTGGLTRRRPTGSWWWKACARRVNIGALFVLLFVAAYRLPVALLPPAWIQPLVAAGLAAAFLGERLPRRSTVVAACSESSSSCWCCGRAPQSTPRVLAGLAGALSMAGVVLTKHWGRSGLTAAFTSWQLITAGGACSLIKLRGRGTTPVAHRQNLIGFTWPRHRGAAASYLIWSPRGRPTPGRPGVAPRPHQPGVAHDRRPRRPPPDPGHRPRCSAPP
ncbi:MAG: hypothetical protein R2705_24110 [Ilumatobacteraceae bacterium]